jgi:hypothetical protein
MPLISMFYGIVIRMFYGHGEHNPPHIHAFYQEHNASIDITTGEVINGSLPRKQLRLVLAWVELKQDDLLADWELCKSGEEPFKISPII